MSIGDVNSAARGSGARYNDGKPPMDLIPLTLIADSIRACGKQGNHYAACLEALGNWQAGGTVADLWRATRCLSFGQGDATLDQAWIECAEVFDYGRNKYAAWNWAKGMKWSAPLACAVRHLFAIMRGECVDPESGKPHRGHFMCNVAMLATFTQTYPEGDDRPTQWLCVHAGKALDMVSMAPPNCDGLSAREINSPHPMQAEAIRDHDERLAGGESHL
jgi:hypothetical protein